MLPFIIGGVTLAAVSYGIKKCLNDEDCIDDVKEKIQDGAIALYDATEALEEKMGLNEYSFTKEEAATLGTTLPIFANVMNSEDAVEETSPQKQTTAKSFHKAKKTLYKTAFAQFQTVVKDDDESITYAKLHKQLFNDTQVDEKVTSYMEQITSTMDTLTHNIALLVKYPAQEDERKLHTYMQSIHKLAHLELFVDDKLNEVAILSTLVESMATTVKKDIPFVDLSA